MIKFQSKNLFEKMELSNFDTRIMKVLQATHHQWDIGYAMSRGIQCSCMSLLSVWWILFKYVNVWDSFDSYCISQKGDLLFKSLNNYKYLGMEDLPKEFFIENLSINVKCLNIRNGEIITGAYYLPITETVKASQ